MTDEEIDTIQWEFSWDGTDMAREIASLRAEVQRLREQHKKIQRDLDAAVGYRLAESGE